MFAVTEAAAIRTALEAGGDLSAAVELHRLFPGITNNARLDLLDMIQRENARFIEALERVTAAREVLAGVDGRLDRHRAPLEHPGTMSEARRG